MADTRTTVLDSGCGGSRGPQPPWKRPHLNLVPEQVRIHLLCGVSQFWEMLLAVDRSDRARGSVGSHTCSARIDLRNGQLYCYFHRRFSWISIAVEDLAAWAPLTVHGFAEPDFPGKSIGSGYSLDATLLISWSFVFVALRLFGSETGPSYWPARYSVPARLLV